MPSINKYAPTETAMTQVTMSSCGRMLIVGTASGSVRAIKYPLTVPWEGSSLPTHCGAVRKLAMSNDDQHLFSVGEDGCVMVYKLSDKEGRGIKARETAWADEILITRADLSEKNKLLHEKETQVRELRVFNDYQLELKEMSHRDQTKEMQAKYEHEIETLSVRLQMIQSEKDKEESKHDEDVADLMDSHTRKLQDLEHQQNQKLMAEYERYKDLQQKAQSMQEKCERQLAEMEHTKAQALEDLAEFWENKLLEKGSLLDAANDANRELEEKFLETQRQIEVDVDQEVLALKNKYERELKEEREKSMRLSGDNGILRKKFKSLARDIDDAKSKREKMETELKKLLAHIKALEKDIESGKKEIQERDETIQDKEKRIYELKKKNQELEKFKFVLDYKIKELKKQIEPRENEIKDMRVRISQMDEELGRYYSENGKLKLTIESLTNKLQATSLENSECRSEISKLQLNATRIRTDVHNAAQFVTEPKHLVQKVRALYRDYCDKETDYTSTLDDEVQREATRQREFLERSASELRNKLRASHKQHDEDVSRIMKENQVLIREINQLRQELKLSKGESHHLEATLRTTMKLSEMRGRTLPDLSDTIGATHTLRESMNAEASEKIIAMQKNEIRKLRQSISSLDAESPARSGVRLEPLQS